jgi:NAD+ kinase
MSKRRKTPSIAFVSSQSAQARAARRTLMSQYDHVPAKSADIIVAIGGDGFMLHTLHRNLRHNVPIFGLNRGTVGFLMNEFQTEDLLDRLRLAEQVRLHPLRMTTRNIKGRKKTALAINEVSLLRQTRQAAHLRVSIDGRTRMDELICDGAMVCTPAGSTAYNFSVHGPILPLGSDVLALTPISAFRPRQWRGAIVPCNAKIRLDILDCDKRPVSAVADNTEVRDVVSVEIEEDRSTSIRLMFDPEHNLEERILREQFDH